MTIFYYFLEMIFAILSLIVFCFFTRRKPSSTPTNWPIVGMLPDVFQNLESIHDYITRFLTQNGGTFEVKGGWFSSFNMVITSDPVNIDYIFNKNFPNYPKGPEFKKVFDLFGDAIINSDFELWKFHRKAIVSFMSGGKFYNLLLETVWDKVQTELIPVLTYFSENEKDFDLQEIFQRFTFDNICKIVLEHDPKSLSIDMPYIPCEKAFNDIVEPLLLRHVVPESIWKLQKWLKIGSEKKLLNASKAFDNFIYPLVEKQLEISGSTLLMALKEVYEEELNFDSSQGLKKLVRDTTLNLMIAGRDTTSSCLTWLFWLIAMNPLVEMRIIEEIESKLDTKKNDGNLRFHSLREVHNLVYLHGALCESLRLFPPIALEHKTPSRSDTLPSGHHLQKGKKMIISLYMVGRMESVWGEDCLEFKPDRWLSDRGVRKEPSYNFPAFSVGPRNCIGKEMAFIQMKMVAASVIHHFKIRLVEGHQVSPTSSVVLQAKQGLKVRLSRRHV